jgi:hypothetical protein
MAPLHGCGYLRTTGMGKCDKSFGNRMLHLI